MESTRQHLEQQQVRGSGLAGEMRQLKEDGAASAAELREFLSQLKDRSPEEVMGAVAQSGLVHSTLLATGGCIVLLVVCTIIPYVLTDKSTKEKEAAVTATAKLAASMEAEDEATDSAMVDDQSSSSGEPDLQRAVEAMGIGDAADTNAEPVDANLDKLLDGIE